ncbi:MAG: response regulator [Elusimicrobia bacterium]|nr:response regulator [Elusimicrobiota bacterium]MBD3412280.1 response regulator [Elusimicrobiota bacterium]
MSKHTILIIEDEKDIADNIMVRLEVEGFMTLCAHDGKKGIESAREHKPDIILLDIMLSKLDGIETCKILKKDTRTKDIPIIMLTSLSAVGDVEKAFAAGANDYLTKPFEYDRLLGKITKWQDSSH